MKLRSLTFVFLFISFVTFILGVWQLYRLNWKNDLIENINNSINTPINFNNNEKYEELITVSLNNDFNIIEKPIFVQQKRSEFNHVGLIVALLMDLTVGDRDLPKNAAIDRVFHCFNFFAFGPQFFSFTFLIRCAAAAGLNN